MSWYTQNEKIVEANISAAATGLDRGKQAEALVARIAQEQGIKVEGFGVKVKTVLGNQSAGDADIVTNKYLIEVKRKDNDVSSDQFAKYVDPRATNFFNPSNKQVVLYVHEGGVGSKTASVQGRYGDKVKIIYGQDQLRAFLGGQ